jgi:hypothetical protein
MEELLSITKCIPDYFYLDKEGKLACIMKQLREVYLKDSESRLLELNSFIIDFI